MMNVATRNLIRLLRAGAFGATDDVEPMSAWKWRRVYEVAVEQGVVDVAYKGIGRLQGQFFLQMTAQQTEAWKKSLAEATTPADDEPPLTNRHNRHTYKAISEEGGLNPHETALLETALRLAHHIIGDGVFVVPLLQMAQTLRAGSHIAADEVASRMNRLNMERMAQLESSLVMLIDPGCDAGQLPYPPLDDPAPAEAILDGLFDSRLGRAGQLHFTQNGNDIFIHTSNSKAMFWQARRSARFFHYYPSESISTLLSSFARSLTDIEE